MAALTLPGVRVQETAVFPGSSGVDLGFSCLLMAAPRTISVSDAAPASAGAPKTTTKFTKIG
jgi:hypothetical protein